MKDAKSNARRFWIVTAICGGIAALFLLLVWGGKEHKQFEPLQWLEFYTQDRRAVKGEKTPVDSRLVLIGIDRSEYSDFSEAELEQYPNLKLLRQNYPWSRAVWADLVTRLADAGAKVIALDLVFGAQGDGDDALKQALEKYKDKVVIGCNFHDFNSDRGVAFKLDLPNASVLESYAPNGPATDDRVGYVNVWPDWDGVLRRARYQMTGSQAGDLLPAGAMLESLDAQIIRKFGTATPIPQGLVCFRYSGWSGTYHAISLADVLGPKTWKQNSKNGESFRDKIVFVGPTADIFQDAHLTPFPDVKKTIDNIEVHASKLMPGPEVHLNIISAALNGTFLREASERQSLLIIALAGLAATALSFLIRQPMKRAVVILVIAVAYWFWGRWMFDHANLIVPEASPLLVLMISGVFVLGYDYFAEQFEKGRIRKTLERYVSKNVVKELLDNPATYLDSLGGKRRPVTVLFCDLRGFTSMTENSQETRLVRNLNEYFAEMTKHVFAHDGTLDKYIGDALMAVWGNIISKGPDVDTHNALATAFDMKAGLAKLNEKWRARGIPELAFGIGINQGEAIVGNLGSNEKMEVTVIGDTVNTASRLESLTKVFGVDLLIGESAAHLVQDKYIVRTVGLIQPKGKTKPSEVFTIVSERTPQTDAKPDPWLVEYEAAVKLYRSRSFAEALQRFQKCLGERSNDNICKRYCAECETLLKTPPDENWNGVFVMTEK